MTRPMLLNNVDHQHLRVATGHGARFGDAVNQAVVFPSEFETLQREYAILLRRSDEGAFRATVLLGLDRDENLFLDGERWDARYVPALHARGPFSIGMAAPDAEPMVHIDLDHPRVGASGEPIFREHGGNAPLLDHAAEVLRTIYAGAQAGEALIAAWLSLDLIVPVALELMLDETRRVTVPDCFTIDAARLAALDGTALDRLHRDDHLRPAFWLASSLGNIRHLLDRKLRHDAAR
ncbi:MULTISPECIES: SapC family protein [unclassified Sphingomonas]|uniref:SapC family protein n=1 Tax=unclassified Sphingomonas TaxID=196159 RepID=UPI00226A185F|nr:MULTISPECIES: SapC family protein [unclassified Sphingomonas]